MQSTAKIKRTFIVPEVVKKDESWVDPTRLCHPPKATMPTGVLTPKMTFWPVQILASLFDDSPAFVIGRHFAKP